jgi:hypothetical protein
MGDRANVYIIDRGTLEEPEAGVWLYTHWGGGSLPVVLQRALAHRDSWDDPSYLARIIFCEMVQGRDILSGGFGISSSFGDNERPILIVDCDSERVGIATPRWEADESYIPTCVKAWDFEEFCSLDLQGNAWAALKAGAL